MRLDPNPLFRRVITPWYSSTLKCWIMVLVMFAIMLFSWAGMVVAFSREEFREHLGIPVIMLVSSLSLFILNFVRLIRRPPNK